MEVKKVLRLKGRSTDWKHFKRWWKSWFKYINWSFQIKTGVWATIARWTS